MPSHCCVESDRSLSYPGRHRGSVELPLCVVALFGARPSGMEVIAAGRPLKANIFPNA